MHQGGWVSQRRLIEVGARSRRSAKRSSVAVDLAAAYYQGMIDEIALSLTAHAPDSGHADVVTLLEEARS